jgi:hypothetical protein
MPRAEKIAPDSLCARFLRLSREKAVTTFPPWHHCLSPVTGPLPVWTRAWMRMLLMVWSLPQSEYSFAASLLLAGGVGEGPNRVRYNGDNRRDACNAHLSFAQCTPNENEKSIPSVIYFQPLGLG